MSKNTSSKAIRFGLEQAGPYCACMMKLRFWVICGMLKKATRIVPEDCA